MSDEIAPTPTWDDEAVGTRDYRAFMRSVSPELVISTLTAEFTSWLESKEMGPPSDDGARWQSGSRSAAIRHLTVGDEELIRCSLVEPSVTLGTWTTEVMASSAGWIQLTVTNTDGRTVKVPRLAKALMRRLDLRDASLQLLDNVKRWDVGDLDQLVDLLLDPDRHGLVFVAGTGPEPGLYQAFHDRIPVWTREVFGLAQSIVLTPQATWALGERLSHHAVAPWTLRTFYPGVDLGSVIDARRHRYLKTATLATERDGRLRDLLADAARRHAARRSQPPEVLTALRLFERAETDALLISIEQAEDAVSSVERPQRGRGEALVPLPEAPTEVETSEAGVDGHEAQVALVRQALNLTVVTQESLAAAIAGLSRSAEIELLGESLKAASLRIKEQSARTEALEDRLRAAEGLLEDDEVDRAILQQELDDARAESRWLRAQFEAAGRFETADTAIPLEYATNYPETCEELVERIATDDDVLAFTGDISAVRDVDVKDTLQAAARMAWDACVSLREYARAKSAGVCEGGVDHFLKNRPAGYQGLPPGRHAAGERQATMNQFGHERVFRVPPEVDPSERMTMTAHFRLARIGMSSPRLYYLDDLQGTGRIYIGYIGGHLNNTQTN